MPDRTSFFSRYTQFPYFTKELLHASAEQFSIPLTRLHSYISKGLNDEQIMHLKRSYYVTREFYELHKTDIRYLFLLANILLRPSYVSLAAALQYYGLCAEADNFTITSVTTKLPRQFKNRTGIYSYRNITEKLFANFKIEKGNFEFIIALPHKAVFDYLYYSTAGFTKNVHPDLLEEMRIDIGEFTLADKKNLRGLIAGFTSIKIYV